MTRALFSLFTITLFFIFSIPQVAANDEEDASEMATFFRSARSVIAEKQKHINDPSVGDKGVSANFVLAKAKENYKRATGKNADESHPLLGAEMKAIVIVMDQWQDLINEKGKGFKGFLPAVFAKDVAKETSKILNGKAEIKLTAPKDYVRNRANRPDKWEHEIIETVFKAQGHIKDESFSELTEKKGKTVFRYILPEYYNSEGCLSCHGEPKGELDITGGKKEGGKFGELGGAISVTIYK